MNPNNKRTSPTCALRRICSVASLLLLILGSRSLDAEQTAFTYQGRLCLADSPAEGLFDFRFSLADAKDLVIGSAQTNSAVGVTNGLFTVVLDFGDVFVGAELWLDISVRTNGDGAFTSLSPRQRLTAAPYALAAGRVINALTSSNAVVAEFATNSATACFATNASSATNFWGTLSSTNLPYQSTPVIDITKAPWNADPTGGSDCTWALTNALQTAAYLPTAPRVVFVPPGRYRIDSTVVIPANGKHDWEMTNSFSLVGGGSGATVIDASGITGNAFECIAEPTLPGGRLNNFHMIGLSIVGPDAVTGGNTSQGAGVFVGQRGLVVSRWGGWRNTFEDLDVSGFRDLFCATNMIQCMLRNCRFWSNYSRSAVFSHFSEMLYLENCSLGYDWRGGTPTAVGSNVWGALVAVGGGVGVWARGGNAWNWSQRAVYANSTPVYLRDLNIEAHWGAETFLIVNNGYNPAPFVLENCKVLAGGPAVGQLNDTNRVVFHGDNGGLHGLSVINCQIDGSGPRPFREDPGPAVPTFKWPTVIGRAFCTMTNGFTPSMVWNGDTYLSYSYAPHYSGVLLLTDDSGTEGATPLPGTRLQVQGGPNLPAIDLAPSGNPAYSLFIGAETIPGGNNNLSLTFGSIWSGQHALQTRQIVFRDENSGFNVGIGTANPGSKLEVQGGPVTFGYGIVTNNGLVWLATNDVPNMPAPDGSIATVSGTDAGLYVRESGSWVKK